MEFVAFNVDGSQFCIRDYQTLGVLGGVKFSAHRQAAAGFGVSNQVDNHLMADQRLPAPVHGDERKQAMLNLVPLAGAWWKVMDLNIESGFLRKATELKFP